MKKTAIGEISVTVGRSIQKLTREETAVLFRGQGPWITGAKRLGTLFPRDCITSAPPFPTGGIAMVVFYFVHKTVSPEGEAKKR